MFALLAGLGALGLLAFSVTPAAASKKKKGSGIPVNQLPWLSDSDKQEMFDTFRLMLYNPYQFNLADMGFMVWSLQEQGFTAEADMLADVALRATVGLPANHPYLESTVLSADSQANAMERKRLPRVGVGMSPTMPEPEPYHGYQMHNVWASKFAQAKQQQPQQSEELEAQMAAAAKAALEA